jgi:hypothetical protein
MSVALPTQGLFLVLLISNLQSSRGVTLHFSPFTQSLASIMFRLCWQGSPFCWWHLFISMLPWHHGL